MIVMHLMELKKSRQREGGRDRGREGGREEKEKKRGIGKVRES